MFLFFILDVVYDLGNIEPIITLLSDVHWIAWLSFYFVFLIEDDCDE